MFARTFFLIGAVVFLLACAAGEPEKAKVGPDASSSDSRQKEDVGVVAKNFESADCEDGYIEAEWSGERIAWSVYRKIHHPYFPHREYEVWYGWGSGRDEGDFIRALERGVFYDGAGSSDFTIQAILRSDFNDCIHVKTPYSSREFTVGIVR
ncbi:MAG: hypothetical protein HYS44_03720 [Candidatus Niyogibacteria bacterium]|nr:hypothetical protein [Candidatus Niyogibacteria bacterium]